MRWRRFRPFARRGPLVGDPTSIEPTGLYVRGRQLADTSLRRVRSKKNDTIYKQTAAAIRLLRDKPSTEPHERLALLLLLSPQAARAQDDLDKHRGGYANRQARVYELIDFNDTLVDLVLALTHTERDEFTERLWNELKHFSEAHHALRLSREQYDAIMHGLSREIAVYLAAWKEGLKARMTSRVQDARGIDMVITDPKTHRSIEIDCKTRSSFHFRLLNLERKRRLEEEERMRCELIGFCKVTGGAKAAQSHSLLLRVATQDLGEINNFHFEDTTKIGELLRRALAAHGVVIVND